MPTLGRNKELALKELLCLQEDSGWKRPQGMSNSAFSSQQSQFWSQARLLRCVSHQAMKTPKESQGVPSPSTSGGVPVLWGPKLL